MRDEGGVGGRVWVLNGAAGVVGEFFGTGGGEEGNEEKRN
jgi:hypothetical protein